MNLQYIRHSFSARLSLWVTGLVTAIFVVALTVFFRFTMSVDTDESLEKIMQTLENTALQADHEMLQTELTANTTRWMVVEHMATPDSIAALCRNVMAANPWIDSCYVTTTQETVLKSTTRWYEPTLDNPADSVELRRMKMTYQLPIFNKAGHPTTTLNFDIQLDWNELAKDITNELPYASCFLQGKGGRYVLDESGYKAMQIGGEASHVFYRVLRNENWGIAIICPDHKMLGGFYRLLTTAVIGALVALLLLLFVCRKLIAGNLKSLDLLSETVRHMSHNQFDKPIPYLGRKDEIGELQLSFAKMQKALKSHIDEIHLKTDTLKQQNAELQSAYERGREDERTKAAFLSQTTEKFMQPVNAIGAAAERLCSQYQDVSKEETEALLADITSNTEVVTNLIGQMLVTSQSTNHTNPTNSADL